MLEYISFQIVQSYYIQEMEMSRRADFVVIGNKKKKKKKVFILMFSNYLMFSYMFQWRIYEFRQEQLFILLDFLCRLYIQFAFDSLRQHKSISCRHTLKRYLKYPVLSNRTEFIACKIFHFVLMALCHRVTIHKI